MLFVDGQTITNYDDDDYHIRKCTNCSHIISVLNPEYSYLYNLAFRKQCVHCWPICPKVASTSSAALRYRNTSTEISSQFTTSRDRQVENPML
jgi:hypothetical protein